MWCSSAYFRLELGKTSGTDVPLPQRVSSSDVCSISRRWAIRADVALALVELDRWAESEIARASSGRLRWPGLWIISGHRSPSLQNQLNPAAPRSLHTDCPSLAVDVRVGNQPASLTSPEVWAWLGNRWKFRNPGWRWGGDFRNNYDPNHFDNGDVRRVTRG